MISSCQLFNSIWPPTKWPKFSRWQLHAHIQYIPRNMHTVCALLCFVVVIHWLIFPYPSGLLHWHCGNLTIAPVPAKQPWWIWINTSCEFIMNDCITTTKQSTTKPCAYFLGYTVSLEHYDDVIMTMLASRITSLTVVYSIVYSGVNQRKHQSSASLAFVREIHRGPVNFPHKWPVTRKMFPFDDVIMQIYCSLIGISLKFVLKDPNGIKSTLIHEMTWCRIGGKPLSEFIMTQFMDVYKPPGPCSNIG